MGEDSAQYLKVSYHTLTSRTGPSGSCIWYSVN